MPATFIENTKSPAEVLMILAKTRLRPFTREDWQAFAGCESREPLIGEVEYGDFTVVLDGDTVLLLHATDDNGGQLFQLSPDRA